MRTITTSWKQVAKILERISQDLLSIFKDRNASTPETEHQTFQGIIETGTSGTLDITRLQRVWYSPWKKRLKKEEFGFNL